MRRPHWRRSIRLCTTDNWNPATTTRPHSSDEEVRAFTHLELNSPTFPILGLRERPETKTPPERRLGRGSETNARKAVRPFRLREKARPHRRAGRLAQTRCTAL